MQHDTTDSTDGSLSECGHDRFERNHYFHGKLMTARDMAAEQAYHVGQRRAHARSVGGSGIAWGLETSVRDDDDAIVVRVERGYAVDECGRPVIVPKRREKTVTDQTTVNAPAVSVYLRYEACLKESVPIDGAETACEDECAYNRVLEVYDLEVEAADAGEAASKRVEPVEFPDWDDLGTVTEAGREAPTPTDHGLATIAESYRAVAPDQTGADENTRVYLGTFTPGPNDPWVRDEDHPRSYVYTNDMLYAATARHTADFGNPHEVSLTSEGRDGENAAAIRVRDDESTQPDVAVGSTDATVTVTHDDADQQVDLSIQAELETLVEQRVAPLERYAVQQALKHKARVFREAADRFDDPAGATAGAVADLARRAVDARVGVGDDVVRLPGAAGGDPDEVDPEDYEALVTAFLTMEQEFRGQVADQVTTDSYERLSAALGGLKTALTPGDPATLSLGTAQDDVVDAVEWLERREAPDEPTEPADATFTDGGTINQERGDIAEIGVQLENTSTATLTIGGEDVGYESTVTVGTGGDDEVTVRMNTYLAGRTGGAESRAFGTAQPADSATAVLNTEPLSGVLESGDYELVLSVDGEETDVGTLTLEDRSTEDLTAYHGPPDVYDRLTDAGSVVDAIEDETVSATGRVEPGETVVLEVTAAGIDGAIAGSFGDRTVVDPRGLEQLQEQEVLDLALEQADAEARPPKRLALWPSVDDGTAALFADPSTDRLLLAVDSGAATFDGGGGGSSVRPAANEAYEAEFAVYGGSPLAASTERVTDTFETVELIVKVPPLEGLSYEEASKRLEQEQLSADPTYRTIDQQERLSKRMTYEQVIDQNPDQGTSVEAGSTVNVTVLTSRSVQDAVDVVGTAYADALGNLGYEYVHELEDADVATLQQEFPNVTEEQIQTWIDRAKTERVATELSLREDTDLETARNVSEAFVASGQTNIASMTDDQIQRVISVGTQNQIIDAQLGEAFLVNSANLNYTTGGSTIGSDDFEF